MLRPGLASLVTLAALAITTPALGATGPAVSVDAAAGRHAISPYIYGWNFVPQSLGADAGVTVDRRGGNAADTLNWRTGVENHSFDFFFENIPSCWDSCPAGWDPAHAYTDQIDADRQIGAKTLIDVPMLGYVPKDEGAADFSQPLPCPYPKSLFATQDSFDQYQVDLGLDPCGNGQNNKQWVTNVAQLTHATADTPADEAGWVDALKGKYGDAAHGGVGFYETGNEPGLWDSTHHDWHPQPTGAQELLDDMMGTAQMVKQHDATAQVIGPAEWGWPNYFCSAADGGCGPGGPNAPGAGSDWTAVQGGMQLMPWLLSQFKAYADANGGRRLLDYLDLHYYRQDNGAAGFDATRSLWDPSYTDQSWINDTIDLIPRMHQWVDGNYPGTKLSLSEYDMAFGSAEQDNLIEADTLGIFAREGLDLATLWPETDNSHYVDAFKLFRNYDGSKSTFGDTYVNSQSADQSQLSIYGAVRSSDGALTLVVINKSAQDLTSNVGLSGFTPGGDAQVWRFTSAASGIQRAADQPVSATGFSATFPAQSMTMLAIPAPGTVLSNGGSSPTPTPTPLPTASGTPAPLPVPVPLSAPRCVVPKLIGLTLAKTKARLKKAHCRLGKVTKKRSPKRKGRVIAQRPKPRSHVKPGTRVAVVLSRGR